MEFAYRSFENLININDYRNLYNLEPDHDGSVWIHCLRKIDITNYFPYVLDMEKYYYFSFDADRVFWKERGEKMKSAIFNNGNLMETFKYSLELINDTNVDIQK